MLSVSGLTKLFRSRDGIAGGVVEASFAVPQAAFFTLLGPSGCGKTTTLRCVAGLERPDAGRISIADQTVFDAAPGVMLPVHRREIGMVFQSYAIWPHMSVAENVSFPLRISRTRRFRRAEIDMRVRRALAMVDLSGFETRPATQLSGGQQQRLALARAVVREPKLLLLDEPLSNLDAKLREEMRIELKGLQQRLGITTVYVTHDQAEALALSDVVAVLDRGRIVQIGSPDAIYHEPNCEFVAGFVGAANLLRGRVIDGAGGAGTIAVRLNDGTILKCRVGAPFRAQDEVAVAVRPEAIRIDSGPSVPSDDNRISARVQSRTFLGQSVTLRAAAAGTTILVSTDAQTKLAPGDEVALVFPARRCVVLPTGASRPEAPPAGKANV
jgi:iron(III) transport system ATP-binding protein